MDLDENLEGLEEHVPLMYKDMWKEQETEGSRWCAEINERRRSHWVYSKQQCPSEIYLIDNKRCKNPGKFTNLGIKIKHNVESNKVV